MNDEEVKIEGNIDIDQALKEFEAESKTGPGQKPPGAVKAFIVPQKETEGIKFETDTYKSASSNEEAPSSMVKLVMKLSGGAIKKQKQAEYILLGFAVVIFAISIFLFLGGSSMFQKKLTPILPAMYGPGTMNPSTRSQ